MKILEVKKIIRKNVVWYTPVSDFTLFKHCTSDDAVAVTGHKFESYVKPLLLLHGVEEVTIV